MTEDVKLDEAGIEAALAARSKLFPYSVRTILNSHGVSYPSQADAVMSAAIRAYLAATKPPLADVTVRAPDDVVAFLLSKALKPEEIAVGSAAREARINELIYWFARYFKGSANPKWLASHAAELAYFIVTASPPMPGRGEGLPAISMSDPMVILAGIKQFGLASDGSDIRDLEAAIERLAASRPKEDTQR